MAIGGQFAAALQALLSKLQQDQAELDFQEQIKRRLFSTTESQLAEAKPLAMRSANQNLADRGIVQSGIGLGQQGNINRAFLENMANLGQGQSEDLAGFARQRLRNQSDYNWNFADLSRQWTDAEAAKAATGTLGNPNPPVAPIAKPRSITPKPPTKKAPRKNPGTPAVPTKNPASGAFFPGVPSAMPTTPPVKKPVKRTGAGIGF